MSNDTQPEIRFPGFTEDWEQRKLGEVVKINGRIGFRGYTQADIIRKEDGGILAFSPTNIINNKLDFNVKNTYITKDKYYESPEIMVKNGDILFVKTGSTLGKSASVSNLNEEATINPQIVILRATSYFISEFISSYLISNNILKQVAQTRIGGAVPTLTETEIKRFQISAPKGKEQQKIGIFFKQFDDTIALHQRKLDLLKETKKGFLQKMFPKNGAKVPEIRFPGFTEHWEERKLGDITESFSGGTPTAGKSKYYGGDIPFIRSGEISSELTELFITENGLNNSSAKMVKAGDILYALYGATSGEVSISRINGAINQAILAIRPTKNDNSYLIVQWLRKQKDTIISTYLQGGQGNLSGSIVKDLVITLPQDKEEQNKIGAFFKQLDDIITLHQRKLDLLKEMKKGFLQKMFV
ncbi:restriction endonuclease subunit S [Enterococcus casseliflavus]|uniref:restriction endonuclease subunit S n=1 Tax=Enterococcus casseliflavus TaxID=37734 RepID=UPI0029530C52|nr:restriction endonuclease subunit S [Enterococcus casseliflavus]MDV7737711.1 restriction endonuclease subunit S [Enterococcus casseliflavus]